MRAAVFVLLLLAMLFAGCAREPKAVHFVASCLLSGTTTDPADYRVYCGEPDAWPHGPQWGSVLWLCDEEQTLRNTGRTCAEMAAGPMDSLRDTTITLPASTP